MKLDRAKELLANAITAYEFELEQQDYQSADELHAVVLNEVDMTEAEYLEVMLERYAW